MALKNLGLGLSNKVHGWFKSLMKTARKTSVDIRISSIATHSSAW
jgi:hypothetical protein